MRLPKDRPRPDVAADLRDGYITPAQAREAYGLIGDDP